MNRIVAITGGSGFIGRRLVNTLESAGAPLRVGSRTATNASGRDVQALDLNSPETCERFVRGAHSVVHLAAAVPSRMNEPAHAEECIRVNALGALVLLQACAAAGVRYFIYVSSGNIYAPLGRAAREEDPLFPSQRAPYYLASKLCGEVYADHFRHTGKVPGATLRVSSVYGPGMAATGLVPTVVQRLKRGEPVVLDDGGRYRADLVHVDDVVAAITHAVSGEVPGIFNVGSGVATDALTLAQTACSLLGRGTELIDVKPAVPDTPPSGFAPLDISRARRDLGYSPRTLRAGIEDYVLSIA